MGDEEIKKALDDLRNEGMVLISVIRLLKRIYRKYERLDAEISEIIKNNEEELGEKHG